MGERLATMHLLTPPLSLKHNFSDDYHDKEGLPCLKNMNAVGIVRFAENDFIKLYPDEKLFPLVKEEGLIAPFHGQNLLLPMVRYAMRDPEEIDFLAENEQAIREAQDQESEGETGRLF